MVGNGRSMGKIIGTIDNKHGVGSLILLGGVDGALHEG
jgi:hypothetical protein